MTSSFCVSVCETTFSYSLDYQLYQKRTIEVFFFVLNGWPKALPSISNTLAEPLQRLQWAIAKGDFWKKKNQIYIFALF